MIGKRMSGWIAAALIAWAGNAWAGEGVVGGFGGPLLRIGSAVDDTVVFAGGRGGALFANGFYLGGEGAGALNTIADDRRLGYGGVFAGLWMPAGAVTDWALEVMVGGGGLGRRGGRGSDGLFVLRPSLRLGFRAAPWLTATVDVGWRQVLLSDTAGLSDGDLSGAELGLGLAFGGRRKPVLE